MLLFALAALFVLRLAAMLVRFGHLIPVKIDISFPEGALVARAWDVAHGESPYEDWRHWPHQFAPYGPLTYATAGWFSRLAGEPAPAKIYTTGRVQSVLSLILIGALLFYFARRLGLSSLWSLACPVAFIVWLKLMEFVMSYRPDAPQTLLSLGALAIAMSGRARGWRFVAAFALLWISFWFKPTGWGMLFALAYWVARDRGWRITTVALAVFGGLGLAGAFAMNAATDGLFFLNLIGSLDNGWRPMNVPGFYARLPALVGLILIGGMISALAALLKNRTGNVSESRQFMLAFVLVYITATALNLKVGADINYYLETYALACVAFVWGAAKLIEFQTAREMNFARAATVAGLLAAFAWDAALEFSELPSHTAGLRKVVKSYPILKEAATIEGEILTTNPMLALARPAPPTIMDHVQFGILASRGNLDCDELLSKLERREFAAIILSRGDFESAASGMRSEPLYCERFIPALRANYRPERRPGAMHVVLRPREPERGN